MCLLEMQTSTAPEPASDSCAGSQEAQAGAPSTSGEGEYPRSQEGKGQLAVKPLHQGLRVRSPALPPPSQNTNQVPVTQPKCLAPSLAPPPESQPNAGHCIPYTAITSDLQGGAGTPRDIVPVFCSWQQSWVSGTAPTRDADQDCSSSSGRFAP